MNGKNVGAKDEHASSSSVPHQMRWNNNVMGWTGRAQTALSSHYYFDMISFCVQGLDGIEMGGAHRGVEAEDDAHAS
jgi:hypothetical protein